jgi:LacI family transcriptional regulator
MNLTQLADHLGLSPATVSRVLGGRAAEHRIGRATQARIERAARQLGVTINQQARGLRLRATHTLGLVAPDISNPFFAAFCREMELQARARGYSVLVADSQESVDVERELVRLMLSRNVDGLVVAPVTGRGAHLEELARAVKPLVLVDRVAPGVRAPAVVLDNVAAARAGVRLLAQAGHREIACLQGVPDSTANRERVQGFRAGLAALGLPWRTARLAGGAYSVASGREGTRRLLAQPRRPTAIIALGNLLALGALEALHGAGVRVPEEMSLLSFDEQPWAASLAPPLTTIAQPVQRMAQRSIDLLFRRLAPRRSRRQTVPRVVLPFTIIRRESVAAPAVRAS